MHKSYLNIDNSIQDSPFPFLSFHLNIKVWPETFHTESNVSYTLIYFPKQLHGRSINNMVSFLFKLNDDVVLNFGMCEVVTLMFSGMLLVHQKNILEECMDRIINLSSYCNQRTFACCQMSSKVGMPEFKKE